MLQSCEFITATSEQVTSGSSWAIMLLLLFLFLFFFEEKRQHYFSLHFSQVIRLRIVAWAPLLRAPWPRSLFYLEPFHCCAAQDTAICFNGLGWIPSYLLWGGPAGDPQKAEDAVGVHKAIIAPQSKDADCYTQWGGCCESEGQHVPARWLGSQSATNFCESVLSVHIHCPFSLWGHTQHHSG